MNDSPEAAHKPLRAPGRWRAAWQALMGRPVVPTQIQAQWAAAQLELEAVLDKITAATARQITRDKRELEKAQKRLRELEGDCGCGDGEKAEPAARQRLGGSRYSPHKRELSRRVLAGRGIDLSRNGGDHESTDQSGEE